MNSVIEGQLAETSGQLNTFFYGLYSKSSQFSFQPYKIEFDTQSRIGEFIYAKIQNKGKRILNMFLLMGNNQIDTFEILIDKTVVYSFTGEYIYLHNAIRQSTSKSTPKTTIIPIMKFLPVVENMQVRLKVSNSIIDISDITLLVDFVFDLLPIDGEYIINQVQTIQADPRGLVYTSIKNVVKEILFAIQDVDQDPLVYTDQVKNIRLQINGDVKFDDNGLFFKYIQPMIYHTSNLPGIYIYSFCMYPEDDMPTGGINMSRIDKQLFTFDLINNNPKKMRIYAVSYNILSVKNNKANMLFNNI
jgi:hypothetical protein